MIPPLLRSSSPSLWHAIGGLEDGSRHGIVLDEKVLGVVAKLGNTEQFLVDESGTFGTSKLEFTVSVPGSDQTWSLQSLWVLFKAASRPRNLEVFCADRTAQRLDKGVVDVLPLAASPGNPSGLVAIGDGVVEGLVDCSVDSVPWEATLPEPTISFSNAIFKKIGWVEEMSVEDHQDVLVPVSKAQPSESSKRT